MPAQGDQSGAEPPKPAFDRRTGRLISTSAIRTLTIPRLPIDLASTSSATWKPFGGPLEADGSRLADDVVRVAGLPWHGAGSGSRRRPALLPEHDLLAVHLRAHAALLRLSDARVPQVRGGCTISISSTSRPLYPRDPRLFDDAIHMTHAGIRLQAWIVFNGLVPIIERRLAAHEWPRPATLHLVATSRVQRPSPRSDRAGARGLREPGSIQA